MDGSHSPCAYRRGSVHEGAVAATAVAPQVRMLARARSMPRFTPLCAHRINSFFDYLWSATHGFDSTMMLAQVGARLRSAQPHAPCLPPRCHVAQLPRALGDEVGVEVRVQRRAVLALGGHRPRHDRRCTGVRWRPVPCGRARVPASCTPLQLACGRHCGRHNGAARVHPRLRNTLCVACVQPYVCRARSSADTCRFACGRPRLFRSRRCVPPFLATRHVAAVMHLPFGHIHRCTLEVLVPAHTHPAVPASPWSTPEPFAGRDGPSSDWKSTEATRNARAGPGGELRRVRRAWCVRCDTRGERTGGGGPGAVAQGPPPRSQRGTRGAPRRCAPRRTARSWCCTRPTWNH